jgi:hypothetical protein
LEADHLFWIEHSPQNSIIGVNSVEHSAKLPLRAKKLSGNLAEGWIDFEPKGGKSARMLGIGGPSPDKAAPEAASSIDTL